ncbi:MAG: hypothetical protein ABI162_10545 [Luteolibacter sp.]
MENFHAGRVQSSRRRATEKAFLKDATPHAALFIEFEMDANFLTDLAADIALLEKANDSQGSGLSDQVGGTAELSAEAVKGIKLRKQLLPLVRNKFKKEPGILAEWESASHLVRVKRSAGREKAAAMS